VQRGFNIVLLARRHAGSAGRQGEEPEAELDAWEAAMNQRRQDVDLEQYRRISARTILAIAAVIAPKEETRDE